jgi:hypothetical protein
MEALYGSQGARIISRDPAKAAERASNPSACESVVQANIDSSSDISKKGVGASFPIKHWHLYAELPIREYAQSSALVASRLEAQDILFATLFSNNVIPSFRTSGAAKLFCRLCLKVSLYFFPHCSSKYSPTCSQIVQCCLPQLPFRSTYVETPSNLVYTLGKSDPHILYLLHILCTLPVISFRLPIQFPFCFLFLPGSLIL